jgi:hypothetical protein
MRDISSGVVPDSVKLTMREVKAYDIHAGLNKLLLTNSLVPDIL